jgi:hypothetical protein
MEIDFLFADVSMMSMMTSSNSCMCRCVCGSFDERFLHLSTLRMQRVGNKPLSIILSTQQKKSAIEVDLRLGFFLNRRNRPSLASLAL